MKNAKVIRVRSREYTKAMMEDIYGPEASRVYSPHTCPVVKGPSRCILCEEEAYECREWVYAKELVYDGMTLYDVRAWDYIHTDNYTWEKVCRGLDIGGIGHIAMVFEQGRLRFDERLDLTTPWFRKHFDHDLWRSLKNDYLF